MKFSTIYAVLYIFKRRFILVIFFSIYIGNCQITHYALIYEIKRHTFKFQLQQKTFFASVWSYRASMTSSVHRHRFPVSLSSLFMQQQSSILGYFPITHREPASDLYRSPRSLSSLLVLKLSTKYPFHFITWRIMKLIDSG